MKKNVSGQKIGAQMVSASDGSAFTGSVTVYVTGDAGTQAAGSVGSGACTHEGNGYHTYAPAQAETNYDLVAFTFIGTGAVPATVQVFTGFPQSVDNATNISSIKSKTDNLPSDPADASDIASAFSTVNGTLSTIAGYIDTEVAAIKAVTDALPDSGALTSIATASALSTVGSNVSAIKTVTDALPDSGALTSIATAAALATVDSNVDAILVDTAEIGVAGAGLTVLASQSLLSTVAGYLDTEIAAIKAVTDALPNAGSLTSLATASALATVDSNVDAIKAVTDLLPDAGALSSLATASALATVDGIVDAILVDTAEIGAAGAGLTVLATQSLLTTVAGYLDTEIAAIKVKTDNLPASPAAVGDIPTATDVADAVWDEAIVGHAGSGSTGEALSAAGASGDPWITALPGSYTAGQAGYIVGTNLDAAVSSVGGGSSDWDADERTAIRSILGIPASGTTPDDPSAGILDTIRDGVVGVKAVTDALPDSGALTSIATAAALATVDSNVDAILVDTAEIGAAGAGLTALASAANLATVAGYIDTEISDIQSRLPAALVSGRMSSDLVSIGGSTTALTAFKSAVQGNVIATVGSASSTTSIVTSAMTPAPSVTDQLKGRILTFKDDTTTAALRGQATDITGSTASGTPTLTVTALTTAPASGDTFTIT